MKKYEDKKLEEASEFPLLKKFPIDGKLLGDSPSNIKKAYGEAQAKYGDKFDAVSDEWMKQAKVLDKKTKMTLTLDIASRLIPKNKKFWYYFEEIDSVLFSEVKLNGLYKEY